MSRVEKFEDLVAWQKSRALASRVYRITLAAPFRNDFVISTQLRKAALSMPSNIAEGFERGGRAEFQQFLSIAKASCAEVRSDLYVAQDIGYLDSATTSDLIEAAEEVARIVGGLRSAVARQRYKT